MKIAYLANIRFPSERAHATQIVQTAHALIEKGTDVTLFANNRVDKNRTIFSKDFGLKTDLTIKRVSHGFFLPNVKLSYYFSEFWFALNFLLTQNNKQFDLIYSRHEWVLYLLSFFIDSKKLVWESHEARLTLPVRRIFKKNIKTIVISEGILDAYEAEGFDKAPFLVAHDGIDNSFFEALETKEVARTRLLLPQDRPIAMYIGGFDPWKGVHVFFTAADSCPDVLFVAVGGDGKQIESLKELYPKVLFLGARPYSELKNNQQAADVLVIPNTSRNKLSKLYTSPLKLFAHMSSGVPLLVSDVPSLVSVTDRRLVTIFKPDEPESLVYFIKEILQNYDKKLKMAEELKRKARQYTWDERAKSIIEFIR